MTAGLLTKNHTENTIMMTNTLNSEKKAIMELDPDVLATVSGGAYTVDESIPEVQAFIEACKAKREYYLSIGESLDGPGPMNVLNTIFIQLGCYRVLEWWQQRIVCLPLEPAGPSFRFHIALIGNITIVFM